jgi:hypothetical protein
MSTAEAANNRVTALKKEAAENADDPGESAAAGWSMPFALIITPLVLVKLLH